MKTTNNIGITGRIATRYEAIAPDGSILKKKSFWINSDTALMGAFQHNGVWIASGITDAVQDWGTQIFLKATRVE